MWQEIRKDFPIAKKSVYLDHAAGGPIAIPVAEKIQQYYRENIESADFDWMKWMRRLEESRKTVADFIHADPEEIAFTTSTSHGMNLIAELISDQGEVLLNTSEFPSSTVPWLWRNAETVFQNTSSGLVSIDEMKSLLKPEVKTVVSSFIQYGTGFRQDIEELGKVKGDRYLAVNATQGFGAFPIDVQKWNCDFLCTNSYKWMMAGYGGGILYIKKEHLKNLSPKSAGWRSMENPDEMDNRKTTLKKSAERYEQGCPSYPTIFGFAASVEYMNQIGIEKIRDRILELTDFLIDLLDSHGVGILSSREQKHRSGIVVADISNVEKVWRYLLHDKVYTSPRGGGLRIAPHFYNNFEDLELCVNKLVSYHNVHKT